MQRLSVGIVSVIFGCLRTDGLFVGNEFVVGGNRIRTAPVFCQRRYGWKICGMYCLSDDHCIFNLCLLQGKQSRYESPGDESAIYGWQLF